MALSAGSLEHDPDGGHLDDGPEVGGPPSYRVATRRSCSTLVPEPLGHVPLPVRVPIDPPRGRPAAARLDRRPGPAGLDGTPIASRSDPAAITAAGRCPASTAPARSTSAARPPVSTNPTGWPSGRQRTCTLAPNPPDSDRGPGRPPVVSRPGRTRVGADGRRAEGQSPQVGVAEGLHDPSPHAPCGPSVEPPPPAVPAAQSVRPVPPRATHGTASTDRRLSRPTPPCWPGRPGGAGARYDTDWRRTGRSGHARAVSRRKRGRLDPRTPRSRPHDRAR